MVRRKMSRTKCGSYFLRSQIFGKVVGAGTGERLELTHNPHVQSFELKVQPLILS